MPAVNHLTRLSCPPSTGLKPDLLDNIASIRYHLTAKSVQQNILEGVNGWIQLKNCSKI